MIDRVLNSYESTTPGRILSMSLHVIQIFGFRKWLIKHLFSIPTGTKVALYKKDFFQVVIFLKVNHLLDRQV